jgi:aryl-alcohol dehydrogenase-like predicted oxidoreductase
MYGISATGQVRSESFRIELRSRHVRGGTEFFRAWGETGVEEARKLLGICRNAGINLIDTAGVYSKGLSEEILGKRSPAIVTSGSFRRKRPSPCGKAPTTWGLRATI